MRGLLITLLVLAALLVGADFGARYVAQDRVGVALQGPLQLSRAPEVDVHGFPFLTQALAGRYDDVELTGSGIRYGQLRDLTLSARLHGVTLPPDRLLAGRVTTIPTDTVDAEARVGADDLGRLLRLDDVTVAPADADDSTSAIRLTSTVTVGGRSVPVTATASARLRGNRVTLALRDVQPGGAAGTGAAGRVVAAAVRARLGTSATVDTGALPFGIRPTGVRAESGEHADRGALVLSGTARDVDALAASP